MARVMRLELPVEFAAADSEQRLKVSDYARMREYFRERMASRSSVGQSSAAGVGIGEN